MIINDLPLLQSSSPAVSQDIIGLGWLSWAGAPGAQLPPNGGPHALRMFSELGGVQQIVCAERCLLTLTRSGKVYSMYYSSDTQVLV